VKSSAIVNPNRAVNSQARDALIIGGGPAGLAAAISLRQNGLDVLVIEALTPPIDKACGEGLMPDARRELARLGVELTGGREFTGIHFASRNRGCEARMTADFPNGKGLGIRRVELHQQLIDRAEEAGVHLKWGTRANLLVNGEVQIEGQPVPHRYLIGADGQASQVRRWAGLEAGSLRSQRLGFRRHYRLKPHQSLTWSRQVEVHWGSLGQAYVTPVAEDEVCVAAVTRHTGINFDSVLDDLPYLKHALEGAESIGRDRGAVTTTRKLRRVTCGNVALGSVALGSVASGSVALIGDASGSADAVTGEGLASTFREAFLLGEALGRDCLADYEAGHPRILRLPQTMASLMLTLDRWPAWRDHALRTLAGSPAIFAAMLGIHLGETSIPSFAAQYALEFAFRLLAPKQNRAAAFPEFASQRTAIDPDFSSTESALAYRPQ